MSKKRKLGSNHWDAIHEKLMGQKRDVTVCSSTDSLCASSLGGGCCPSDRSCGVSSCYATVATTTTTSCSSGFSTCGIAEGGGCCPFGYSCERNGCIAPTGSSVTQFCNANSYLCPSSLNYGCCRNGLSCGISTCHETTSTETVTLTETLTSTNSNSEVTTITTVIETVYNPSASTEYTTPVPTPIAKLPAITSSTPTSETSYISTPSNGINSKELGGIVAACISLLLIVLVATYFILRRLNLTIKLTKIDGTSNRPGGSNSTSSRNMRFQSIGIDPLQQVPSTRTGSQSHQPWTNQTTPSELSDNTPLNGPVTRPMDSRSSRVPFSSLNWSGSATSRSRNTAAISSGTPGAYRSLPSSDSSRHWRNDSEGSQTVSNPTTTATMNGYAAELQQPDPQGYFDIPIPKTAAASMGAMIDPALRDQNLRFGRTASIILGGTQRPSIEETRGGHGRQWSDVSELSNGTETTNESYELDDTSPKPSYGKKFGYGSSKGAGYGYGLYGSNNDKRSLREGVKDRVQGWVGMTSLGRKNSRRSHSDDASGSARGGNGLGGFKMIPSPSPTQSPPLRLTPFQDQDQPLRGMEPPLPSFTRFGDKGRLEAIREALRESGTTINSNTNTHGEVSESRAQIARMELKRADSDLTLLTEDGADAGESEFKELVL